MDAHLHEGYVGTSRQGRFQPGSSTRSLAPDATVDDVLPRLTALVRKTARDGLPTVLMRDSAGGALVLVLARRTAPML
jgi:hypothetical protein